jgi:hypothetical protein
VEVTMMMFKLACDVSLKPKSIVLVGPALAFVLKAENDAGNQES